MGDGRYYTAQQFLTTLYLMAHILLSISLVILVFYRIDQYRKILRLMGFTLSISLISFMLKTVAIFGDRYRLYQALAYSTCIVYVVTLIFYIIYRIKVHQRSYIGGENIASIMVLFIVFPLMYREQLLYVYLILMINYILIVSKHLKYRLTNKVFDNVQKMILDYVLICDEEGKVVYRTQIMKNSNCFSDKKRIDTTNVTDIFTVDVIFRNIYDKDIIMIQSSENQYFQYIKKEITDKDKTIGYIFTYTDITQLINMLDIQERSREQIFRVGVKLKQYESRVYEIEKSREINLLMADITANQLSVMQALQKEMYALSVDDTLNKGKLKSIASKAKLSLQNVRSDVTKFLSE